MIRTPSTADSSTPVCGAPARISILAVALGTLAFQLPFFDRWFSAMDEGHMLAFAQLVNDGGMLYRDATIYPLPGAFYLLAGIFRLAEPSILLSRWVVALEFAMFVAVVFVWIRRCLPPRWALMVVGGLWLYRIWAFPHWQIYSYSTTTLLLLVVCFLLLLRFFERGGDRWLTAAGLVYGVSVFCKQDYSAAALLAIGPLLALSTRGLTAGASRSATSVFVGFFAPAAVVGALAGLHFLLSGILPDVIQMTVLNHFIGMSSYEYSSLPGLLPLFEQDPHLRGPVGRALYMPGILFTTDWHALSATRLYTETALYDFAIKAFFYVPYPLAVIGAARLWWCRTRFRSDREQGAYTAELALCALGAALLLLVTLNKPQDYLHFAVLLWAWPGIVCIWLHEAVAGRRWRLIALCLVLAPVLLPTLAYSARLGVRLRTIHSEPLRLERAGIYVKPSEARLLRDVVGYLRTSSKPSEPVLVAPYFPLLHFLADRPGPHGASYILWPFPEFPDRDERVIAALEAQDVRVGVYNHTQFQSFPSVQEYAPLVFQYLVKNFETDRVFAYDHFGYKLSGFRRSASESPGRPILAASLDGFAIEVEPFAQAPRSIPSDARHEYVRFDLWPFRPVVALRPAPYGSRTVLTVEVPVPEDAALETAIGFFPESWFTYPGSWVRFTLDAELDGRRTQLFSRILDPHRNFDDRGWFDLRVPLDDYAGSTVKLRFSTEAERQTGEIFEMGGWELPRLVRGATISNPRPRGRQ